MNYQNEAQLKKKERTTKMIIVALSVITVISLATAFLSFFKDDLKSMFNKEYDSGKTLIFDATSESIFSKDEITINEPTGSQHNRYDFQLITESKFDSLDDLTNFYLKYWDENNCHKTALEVIENADVYDDELIKAAAVKYIIQEGRPLESLEDEFFYLQVSGVKPGSGNIESIILSWTEDLLVHFPEDFNKFSILNAYRILSKEIVIINSLANGEKVVNWEEHICVNRAIAELSYDTFGRYYPIHKYFGVKEKSDEEKTMYRAYVDILNRYDSQENSYALYDIDKDSVKELIVSYGRNGELHFKCDFYTIKDGKAVFIGATNRLNNTYLVFGDDGALYNQFAHMNYESIWRFDIENGRIKETGLIIDAPVTEGNYTDLGRYVKFISVEHTYMVE